MFISRSNCITIRFSSDSCFKCVSWERWKEMPSKHMLQHFHLFLFLFKQNVFICYRRMSKQHTRVLLVNVFIWITKRKRIIMNALSIHILFEHENECAPCFTINSHLVRADISVERTHWPILMEYYGLHAIRRISQPTVQTV